MPYPRFQRSRTFKFLNRTAGSVVATTSWQPVDSAGAHDLVIEAQTGDVLVVAVSAQWDPAATNGRLDAVTINASGTPVGSFSGTYGATSTGVAAWLGASGVITGVGGSVMRTITSGEIFSGQVTVRLMLRSDSAASKTLIATAADPLQFSVRNIGPADPT